MAKKYVKLRPIWEQNKLQSEREFFKQELKDVAKLIADKNFKRLQFLRMFNSHIAQRLTKLI